MVEIKTDTALEMMREAGRVVAHALAAARAAAAVEFACASSTKSPAPFSPRPGHALRSSATSPPSPPFPSPP